ncbi:hypothetical protein GCM10018790_14200 [Kitasatospora xanthocidica]|uniref:DUF7825 domain-containing protein n=1 Tax=Kitasatospora xanthocidica TaxID=83382 RepID=UPI001678FA3B|nr:DUF6493 family protein [Kitasatospora xanthocidica]GHF37688.1 hypothetical protein GCM10018790_14200 [Kitasatospora xanthocidica]
MTDRTNETISWDDVRALIADRVPQGVIDRLSPVPAGELRHLRTPLRKLRTELARELSSGDHRRYSTAYDQLAALQFAGIHAAATPAEALDWLTSRRLLDACWPLPGGGSTNPDEHAVLLALLQPDRDAEFHRELAIRLAEWLPVRGDGARWLIAHGLAVWSGAELPTTDGYVIGWVRQGSLMRYHHREIAEWFAERGLRGPAPHHDTLLSWLRAQPRLAEFVRRLFEVPDVGTEFADPYAARFGPDNEWPRALTTLAGEGLLDRAELIDLCLGRLLRGDRPGNLRGFLQLYAALSPDADEVLARAPDHVRLAAAGAPTAAKAAQTALLSVDARLPSALFAELTTAVLTRPEKALATTQLSRADAALRRDPSAADALLPAIAAAFTHPAPAVQERALRLAARHLPDTAPATAEAVRAAATALGAALRSDARRLLAVPASPPSPTPALPAPPAVPATPAVPARHGALPTAPAGPFDLAERLGAVMADRVPDPGEFEVVFAALVAEHHCDPAALRTALAPLAARRGDDRVWLWEARSVTGALGCLLDALTDRPHESERHTAELLGLPGHLRTPAVIPALRVHETACRISDAPVPCLLATPTAADGTIDPAVLTERLASHRAAGARPWPADLAQSLLRTPPQALPAVRAAAAGLGCDLPSDTVPPAPDRFHVQSPDQPEQAGGHGRVPPTLPRIAPLAVAAAITVAPVPDGLAALLHALPDPTDTARFAGAPSTQPAELAQLPWLAPWHPEAVAAHALPGAVFHSHAAASRETDPLLPRLADTPGELGPVSHLLLAYGLTATRAENRTAALDALLTANARGRLRPEALGTWLAALWRLSVAKPNRVLPVLADAVRSGEGRAVWTVLTTLITELAAEPGRRGLADTLALAAECAATEHIRTALPALDILTTPTAPRRVRTEATRLTTILTP